MQNVFSILGLVVSDKFIFPIFEILFLLLIFYAIAKDIKFRRGRGIIAVIKRGEESWKNLYISYGVASVIVMQIISV